MRKYALLTGIIALMSGIGSFFYKTLAVMFVRREIEFSAEMFFVFPLILFFVSFLCLLYLLFAEKLSKILKVSLFLLIVLFSLFTNFLFVSFVGFCIANFPPTKSFNEDFIEDKATMDEEKAFLELYQLAKADMSNTDNYALVTEDDKRRILDLLSRQTIAYPDDYRKMVIKTSFSNEKENRYEDYIQFVINIIIGDEYKIIKRLLEEEKFSEAQNRYIIIFKAAKNLLLVKNSFQFRRVGNFNLFYKLFLDNPGLRSTETIKELKNVLRSLDTNIEKSLKTFLVFDYKKLKYLIEGGLIEDLEPWPAFDKNRLLKIAHNNLTKNLEMVDSPYYMGFDKFTSPHDLFEDQLKILINPYHYQEAYLKANFPIYDAKYKFKELCLSQCKAFRYLVERLENQVTEIPLDNLTGEKFKVTTRKDFIQIQSAFVDKDKSAVDYKLELN